MTIVSASRTPISLKIGDIITEHPDHPGEHGAWTIAAKPEALDPFTAAHAWKSGERVAIDYTTTDGATGRFIVPADTDLKVRPLDPRRADYIAGLRQLADLLDANPGLPMPYRGAADVDFYTGGSAEAFAELLGRPGSAETASQDTVRAQWTLGGLKINAYSRPYEPVVVGIRVLDGREIPVTEQAIPDQLKPADAEKAQVKA